MMKRVTGLNEYQKKAMNTLYYFGSKERQLEYAVLALCGEAGELANTLKKIVFYKRNPYYKDIPAERMTKYQKNNMIEELSDVLWYVACVADALDIELSKVATFNIDKILAKGKVAEKQFDTLCNTFKETKGGGSKWRIK